MIGFVRKRASGAVTDGSAMSGPSGDRREAVARRLLRMLDPDVASRVRPSESGDPFAEDLECDADRDEVFAPDVVGAAVLLGFGLCSRPGLLERIGTEAPVVVAIVPDADWIDPMTRAAVACFGGGEGRGSMRLRDEGKGQATSVPAGAVVVAARGRGIDRHSNGADTRTFSAFREHRALIGIATSAETGLPPDLRRACEERIVIRGFDPAALALVVEHVVGEPPVRRAPEIVAAAVEPSDLRIAIHPARGADGSVDRLATMVGARLGAGMRHAGPRLEDLVGYGAAAEWGLAAAADLAAYGRGELPWCDCEPGALLAGPPGTGKTMFASALARQADVPLLAGSLARWQSEGEAHLGTTLKAMRQFFETARKQAPCVALVDELDSFGDRQRFAHYHRDYSTQIVNGFLECLDGDGGRPGVVLVGTTNDPGRIDPAILRSGRFDRCIAVPLPSVGDIAGIMRHHLGDDLGSADLTEATHRAMGGTGADCAAWVRRARGRARRARRPLELADLLHVIDAATSSSDVVQDRRTAVHESGHAVVARALGMAIGRIVLRSPGRRGDGVIWLRPPNEKTCDAVHDLLAVHLAGRAAEILVLGEPSAGATDDLARATSICTDMHCRWGLGERLAVRDPDRDFRSLRGTIERDLCRASERAGELLVRHRSDLDRLAQALLERRSLEGDAVEALLGRPPPYEPSS